MLLLELLLFVIVMCNFVCRIPYSPGIDTTKFFVGENMIMRVYVSNGAGWLHRNFNINYKVDWLIVWLDERYKYNELSGKIHPKAKQNVPSNNNKWPSWIYASRSKNELNALVSAHVRAWLSLFVYLWVLSIRYAQ